MRGGREVLVLNARVGRAKQQARLEQVPVHNRPRQGVKQFNMAEKAEQKTSGRKVLVAVDGSEHGDRAFDCKFIITFRPAIKIFLFYRSCNAWKPIRDLRHAPCLFILVY